MNERMVYIDQLHSTKWLDACLYILARHTRDPSGLVTTHVIHIHHGGGQTYIIQQDPSRQVDYTVTFDYLINTSTDI